MTKVRLPNPVLLTCFLMLLTVGAKSQTGVQDDLTASDPEVGIVEHLDEYLPTGIYVTGEDSRRVTLTDLIDKPTILNLVYYRCPGICSPLMEGIVEVMNKSDLVAGKDYQVLTVSFEPAEPLELAIRKKESYLNLADRKDEVARGWKFFISDSASIAKLTDAVGFKYKKTGNDYTHAASIMAISPGGKITRYLNGLYFLPFEFKMALVEAGKGTSGPTINKILQFCYSYDPQGKTYVLNVTKVAGTLILFFSCALLLFLLVKPKKKII